MSVSETHELETAAQKLNLDTLKRSLEANECDNSGKKDALVQRLGSRVLEIGVEGFLDSLSKQDLADICEGIKFKETGTRKKENLKIRLFRHILDKGLEYFLQDCTQEQLTNFCSVLLLEQSSNDAMVSQIADEIMLTGTKRFLHKIAVVLLKRWCEQLGITPASAKKKQLVEQLMVHIFELEPLDEGDQEEDEGEQDGASTKDDDGKGEGNAKKEQGTGKREKYVPPPLSTIKKGVTKEQLHNTFNATDLKEFCKQNNMPATGKKPLLIKRIIKFLETGEIEVPKVRRGGKRKRGPTDKSGNSKRAKSNGADDTNQQDNEDEEEEESEEVPNGQERMSEDTATSKPDAKTEEESETKETANGTPPNSSVPSASTGEVGEGGL